MRMPRPNGTTPLCRIGSRFSRREVAGWIAQNRRQRRRNHAIRSAAELRRGDRDKTPVHRPAGDAPARDEQCLRKRSLFSSSAGCVWNPGRAESRAQPLHALYGAANARRCRARQVPNDTSAPLTQIARRRRKRPRRATAPSENTRSQAQLPRRKAAL